MKSEMRIDSNRYSTPLADLVFVVHTDRPSIPMDNSVMTWKELKQELTERGVVFYSKSVRFEDTIQTHLIVVPTYNLATHEGEPVAIGYATIYR